VYEKNNYTDSFINNGYELSKQPVAQLNLKNIKREKNDSRTK